MNSTKPRTQFAIQSRILHWLMAAMILAMLFIGVSMLASLADYRWLVAIHRPLGIAILILAVIRLMNRKLTKLPAFPPTMSPMERFRLLLGEAALRPNDCDAAHWLGYALGRSLSHLDVRIGGSAAHPAAASDAVRLPATLPYDPRLPSLCDDPRACWRGAFPHAHRSRSPPEPNGHLAD